MHTAAVAINWQRLFVLEENCITAKSELNRKKTITFVIVFFSGGRKWTRTIDLLRVKQAL